MANEANLADKPCQLCNSDSQDLLLGGKYETDGIVAHYFCVLLSDHSIQTGKDDEGIFGFMSESIRKEINRGKKLKCCYCKQFGATITCRKRTCVKTFHLPCGRINNTSHIFQSDFPSFCTKHRIPERIPHELYRERDLQCVMCLTAVNLRTERRQLIRAGCCKAKTLMHRTCAQQYFTNAGYDTKCPICGNHQDFIEDLQKKGVFFYMRDAKWETSGDFDDLYQEAQCAATVCKGPDRREHMTDDGALEVIICNRCLTFPSHRLCAGITIEEEYFCQSCSEALATSESKEFEWMNSNWITLDS